MRIVAELVRHATGDDRGLSAIGKALGLVRERGVDTDNLVLAAQVLDDVCSESAVVASVKDVLELSLGADKARCVLCDVVEGLARRLEFNARDAVDLQGRPGGVGSCMNVPDGRDLAAQVAYVVRTVGKSHARRYLRVTVDLALVPIPLILGL